MLQPPFHLHGLVIVCRGVGVSKIHNCIFLNSCNTINMFFKKTSKSNKIIKNLEGQVSEAASKIFDIKDVEVSFDIPTDKTKADLVSNASFSIAKKAGKSPLEIAQAIVDSLAEIKDFDLIASAPGFINANYTNQYLNTLIRDIKKLGKDYGRNQRLKGLTYVIEHTSPNPNKAMHIGHLRNNLTGMSLVNICKMSGAKVISEAVDNDRGIAIAKAMWGFLVSKKKDGSRMEDLEYWSNHKDEWSTPDDVDQKADHFVDECYLIGSEDFKSNPKSEELVRSMVVDWENKDEDTWNLWKLIIGYAHKGMEDTLSRIGNHWDIVWHEHEHYMLGKDLVLKGLEKGIFKKLEDGAVLTDLESYNLPDTILLKSDGTSLYITQDIALTKLKKNHHRADKLMWVIGPEQSTAMKQVFACCEQLGIGKLDEFVHIPYGLVNILDEDGKAKKMSSRGGEVVHIDTLIDNVKKSLLELDRGYDDALVEKIAVGAIKHSILRASRNTNVVLDIEKSVSLTGDSGVYLMYTMARINSLIGKAPSVRVSQFDFTDKEKEVLSICSHYPRVIENSLKDLAPNLVIDFLLDLSQSFNALYAQDKFISDDAKDTAKKICISSAVKVAMENAFGVVGIEIPERV